MNTFVNNQEHWLVLIEANFILLNKDIILQMQPMLITVGSSSNILISDYGISE